jgi:hypothetical protein
MARMLLFVLGVSVTFLGLAGRAAAEERADCTVRLTEKSVAVGIGVSWGRGELTCGAKTYRFKVSGVTVQDVGASETDATGFVYDLHDHRDFAGTYTAVTAGAVAGGGTSITTMRNAKGVRVTLRATKEGAQLTAGPEGMKITLE